VARYKHVRFISRASECSQKLLTDATALDNKAPKCKDSGAGIMIPRYLESHPSRTYASLIIEELSLTSSVDAYGREFWSGQRERGHDYDI
jgi:hypothetical protein